MDAAVEESMSVQEALQFRKRRLAREGSNLSAASSAVHAIVDPYGGDIHDSDSEDIFEMADQYEREEKIAEWQKKIKKRVCRYEGRA